MVIDFYYASGSPYAWRVWLAFEHKNLGYDLRLMSFDAGDLEKPEFLAINPRHKVPAIVDRGFALYESAAILEYLESAYASSGGRLFPVDSKQKATARRMVCETDQYVAKAMESLADEVLFTDAKDFDDAAIAEARSAFAAEMQQFERSRGLRALSHDRARAATGAEEEGSGHPLDDPAEARGMYEALRGASYLREDLSAALETMTRTLERTHLERIQAR
jgi:hypothetical protein